MYEHKLGVVEERFADIIWANEPISSGKLVTLCAEQLEWKKSTTYTVLRKLCQRGIFVNQNGVVSSKISKGEYQAMQSEEFVEETFKGSLPAFIAAFTSRKKLTMTEVEEICKMIRQYGED